MGSIRRRAQQALVDSGEAGGNLIQWREEQVCSLLLACYACYGQRTITLTTMQACLDCLEFEWLRQWHAQGPAHRKVHGWWTSRIDALEQLWLALERLTCVRVRAALGTTGSSRGGASQGGSDEELLLLREALARRQRLRGAWAERERDALYAALDAGHQPLPCLHAATRLAGTCALRRPKPEARHLTPPVASAERVSLPTPAQVASGALAHGGRDR